MRTNSLHLELQPRGITVTELHVGYMYTDLVARVDAPKPDPREVAALALHGVERGAYEVLADDVPRQAKAGLAGDLATRLPAPVGPPETPRRRADRPVRRWTG